MKNRYRDFNVRYLKSFCFCYLFSYVYALDYFARQINRFKNVTLFFRLWVFVIITWLLSPSFTNASSSY